MRHDENERDRVAGKSEHEGAPTPEELRFVERWGAWIDRDVAGDLDEAERAELERAAARDAELREALADARATARLFADAPRLRAPEGLDDRILAAIDRDERAATTAELVTAPDDATVPGSRPVSRRSPAPRSRRREVSRWGALVAVAAAVVLMVVAGPTDWFTGPSPDPSSDGTADGVFLVAEDGTTYSEAEVRAAAEQVEMAMAVFGRTMDRTTRAVRSEVTGELNEHVTEPLREGIGRSVNSIPYLRPRKGDEEHSGMIPDRHDLHEGERPLRSRALESAHTGERT